MEITFSYICIFSFQPFLRVELQKIAAQVDEGCMNSVKVGSTYLKKEGNLDGCLGAFRQIN